MAEAAERLSITKEAVRKRIHRGTLGSARTPDGTVMVYVPPSPTADGTPSSPSAANDLHYAKMRERIRYLECQVEEEREARRRADTLLARLMDRLPELEAPAAPARRPAASQEASSGAGPARERHRGSKRLCARELVEKGVRVVRGDQPLLEAKTGASGVFSSRPARLLAFEDAIEVITAVTPFRKDVQRVRYDQVAQVSEELGVMLADLVVETRGGDTLRVPGLTRQEARRVGAFIRERMLSSAAEGSDEPAPLDIPDQIKKLAELRDSGASTNDEFERKKAELLGRM